jgi:predicted restriction endonuclease
MGFNPRGVCGTSGGVTASNLIWEAWLERLYNLRRDKRGSHERPHKPVLLLSIIDLLDRGFIAGNEVPLSEELVATFKRYFAVVRKEDDQPTIQNPFFHLCGDKFWQLVPAPGESPVSGRHNFGCAECGGITAPGGSRSV